MGGDSFSNIDLTIINSATSVDEIIQALAQRGCANLTSLIDLNTCSQVPYALGGFCDVYRGSMSDGTKIAIKSLRVCDGPEADIQKRKILKHAARELYHWSKLQHPNVLGLMGLTLFRDRIALISEWMDNGNLMSFLRINPDADRIVLCMDVCAGLCYIHSHGMVHGDVKSANVMVSFRGVAMIADFGNAQLKDFSLKFSNTAGFAMTLRWTAPELLDEGMNPLPTKEADVYAFGMTMLEVLTGEVPFQTKKEREVLVLVLRGERPARPEANMQDGLWELLNCCWSLNPTDRPSIKSISNRLLALDSNSKHHVPCPGSMRWTEIEAKAKELHSINNTPTQWLEDFGKLIDIDRIINYYGEALQITLDMDMDKPHWVYWLGISHFMRFRRQSELSDIDQAINHFSRAVQLAPYDDTNKSDRFYWLGRSHICRLEHSSELSDIDQAICHLSRAVQLTSDDNADKSDRLHLLSGSYFSRFERQKDLSDIDQAIIHSSRAVQLIPDDNTNKPDRLDWLGSLYSHLFEHCKQLSGIDQAISYLSRAVHLMQDDDANKPERLYRLGIAHFNRFRHQSELSDCDQAINHFSRAVKLGPDDDTNKSAQLCWLGKSHLCRFERSRELLHVNQAISCYSRAVLITPDENTYKPSRLYWLARSHLSRFERSSELSDIDQAISQLSRSVQLTSDDNEDMPDRLYMLGGSYFSRFMRQRELPDIDQAIIHASRAVQLTPDGNQYKPDRLHSLGGAYFFRFDRRGELSDIDQATNCFSQAVQLTPDDDTNRLDRVQWLEKSRRCRSERDGWFSPFYTAKTVALRWFFKTDTW